MPPPSEASRGAYRTFLSSDTMRTYKHALIRAFFLLSLIPLDTVSNENTGQMTHLS